MSDRGQAIVNDVYSSDLKPNEDDPEFYKYYDNYGFKRQIRRRHSSGSYNHHYSMTPVLPPSFKEFHYYNKLNGNNNNFDDYNHLERSSSFVTMPPLNRNVDNSQNLVNS